MATRFDASTDNYVATTGLPSGNVYTVTCWLYLVSDRNTYQTAWGLDIGSNATGLWLETNSDGTTLGVWSAASANAQASIPLTVGTWYQTGVVVNGTSITFYRSAAGSPLTSGSTTLTGANPPTRLIVGNDSLNGAAWLDGRLSDFKMWNAALTADEVAAELAQHKVSRGAGLLRWHPWLVAETADYSGGGNSLTAGGTATTTEDGPPIPWTVARTAQPVAALRRAANF